LKKVAGYRLRLKSDRSDLSTYATNFDLVNVCGKKPMCCHRLFWALTWLTVSAWFGESRYVAIGFGMLTYFDYRQNQIGCLTSFGKAISIDSKGDFLQWSRLLAR
jgi:hypothetical protein